MMEKSPYELLLWFVITFHVVLKKQNRTEQMFLLHRKETIKTNFWGGVGGTAVVYAIAFVLTYLFCS